MNIKHLITIVLFSFFFSKSISAQQKSLILWYDKPAKIWEETPGMTPDGDVNREDSVLNDITLWSGGKKMVKLPPTKLLQRLYRNGKLTEKISTKN